MFGLSFSELLIIGVVSLIVLGPERLPKVARTVGHLLGRAQRYMNDVKSDIQREMDIQELNKLKDEVKGAATALKDNVEKTVSELKDPLANIKQEMGDITQQLKKDITQDLPDLSALKKGQSSEDEQLDTTATMESSTTDGMTSQKNTLESPLTPKETPSKTNTPS